MIICLQRNGLGLEHPEATDNLDVKGLAYLRVPVSDLSKSWQPLKVVPSARSLALPGNSMKKRSWVDTREEFSGQSSSKAAENQVREQATAVFSRPHQCAVFLCLDTGDTGAFTCLRARNLFGEPYRAHLDP